MNRTAAQTFVAALTCALVWSVVAAAQVGKGLLDANTAGEQDLMGVPGFTQPLVTALMGKRPFASQGNLPTRYSTPRSFSSSSEAPTEAISGQV